MACKRGVARGIWLHMLNCGFVYVLRQMFRNNREPGHAVFKVSYACMYIMCNPTTHPTYTYQITVDYDCTLMYICDSLLSEIVITYIHYLSTVIQDKLLLNLEHIKTLNLTLVAPHCLFIKEVYQRLHFVFLPVTFIIINITPFTLRRTNKKVVIRCHYISIFQLRMTNF